MPDSPNYYSSSRRVDDRLPPLRSHLPEFFRQPGLPSTYSPAYNGSDNTLIKLPPIRQHESRRRTSASDVSSPSPTGNTRSSSLHSSSQAHPTRSSHSHNETAGLKPTYSVYNNEMEEQRTSTRDYFPSRVPRADPEDSSKRYVCTLCPSRFDRPSALETHMRTHTDQRPFTCGYPDCGRAFTVKSNLLRHERTHTTPGLLVPVEEDEPTRSSTRSSSHQQGGSSSSPSQKLSNSSSSYYSSSRRK